VAALQICSRARWLEPASCCAGSIASDRDVDEADREATVRDVTDDDMDGTRWLSCAELAEARGISKRSAIRLTFRHRW
jgi:hypothetical protein